MGLGTEVFSNGPGHMTKMATMPVFVKTLKNLLLPVYQFILGSPPPQYLVPGDTLPRGKVVYLTPG